MPGDAPVTREEFDRLLVIVHDMLSNVPHHTHGVSDGSMYGGSTYGPEERDRTRELRERVLALIGGENEPGKEGDDADDDAG